MEQVEESPKLRRLNSEEEDLFYAIRKGNLNQFQSLLENGVKTDIINLNNKNNSPLHYAVEKGNTEIIKELLLSKWNTNINVQNNEGDTPLHIAVSKGDKELVQLLLNNQAKVNIKNNGNEIPLDIANRLDKQSIVQTLVSNTHSSQQVSAIQQQSPRSSHSKLIGDQSSNEQSSNDGQKTACKEKKVKHKSQRRAGTTGGIEGHFYEIDLLILGKLRGERDTDEFYLETNVNGVGAFDDIVFKYRNKEQSQIILLQAKHAESSRKGKITIEKFKNPKNDNGKFYLGKYLLSYLESKKKFKDKSTDIVFKGKFKELDVRCIIYTNSILDERFDEDRIIDVENNIFFTTSKDGFNKNKYKAFKFKLDKRNSDLLTMLEEVSCRERIKLLAKALVGYICGNLNYITMMTNELFSTYHVFLSKSVIEVKEDIKEDNKKIKYREGKVKSEFLNYDNKTQLEKSLKEEVLYEYAKDVFSEKATSELGNKSERDDLVDKVAESLKSSKKVGEDVIEKLSGIVMLDTKKKKLKFADQEKLTNENAKQFIKDLENIVHDLASYKFDIPYELVKNYLKERTENEPLKLPVNFGNISPNFKKKEHLINQLIKLFIKFKSRNVIVIDDNIVGHKKLLTDGDKKNLGKLVGNLLVFDQTEKKLKFASEESLDEKKELIELIKELKTTAKKKNLKVDDYGFDIKVKNFPRDSLFTDEEDKTNVEEFLKRLEIFTGQASDKELQNIIKDEMRNFYKLTEEEVEDNFLKIRDESEKFWRKEEDTYYLEKNDHFFTNVLRFNFEFDVRDPVDMFFGRKEELDDLHTKMRFSSETITAKPQIISICGLGGIGKTQLAKRYIQEHAKDYDGNILWISAGSEALFESFRRLAKDKLMIRTKDADGNEKNIKSIIEDVYKFFAKRKSLFIFDDAEDYNSIKEFLPHSSYPDNKPHILITSRNREWEVGEIKIISLGVFKPNEAKKFVEDFLKIKRDSPTKDIEELTKQLKYFPLALRQAVTYIKQEDDKLNKRGNERFEISNYLEKRQKQENQLLDESYYKISDNYTKTILTTWITTLEKISMNSNYGRQAIDILNSMAYFAPDRLNLKELFSMSDAKWNAVELLDQYSMINLKNGVADIHNLVQEVTRQRLKMENKDEEVLEKILKEIDNSNISKKSESHIISVWDYASKYSNLVHEFCSIFPPAFLYGRDKNTPVHLLVRGGKKDGIDNILKIWPEGKDILNNFGETPLYEAIECGYKEIIECLIEVHNVDLKNYISGNGHKPITRAAFLGKEDLVKYFVSKGADVNSCIQNELSTLDCAVFSGNISLVKYLVDEGAKSCKSKQFGGALHAALGAARAGFICKEDALEIIKICLQKDRDLIKSVDLVGRTPLHVATQLGFINIVDILLDTGTDINAKSDIFQSISFTAVMGYCDIKGHDRGYTALHIAAEENNMKIVEILLKNGAHYNIKNMEGKTPLNLAKPESGVKNLLVCTDNLFKAVQDGNKSKVVSLLKDESRNTLFSIFYSRNTNGSKLTQVAGKMKRKDIVELLLRKLQGNNFPDFPQNIAIGSWKQK